MKELKRLIQDPDYAVLHPGYVLNPVSAENGSSDPLRRRDRLVDITPSSRS